VAVFEGSLWGGLLWVNFYGFFSLIKLLIAYQKKVFCTPMKAELDGIKL
jgi:hypothetical protein